MDGAIPEEREDQRAMPMQSLMFVVLSVSNENVSYIMASGTHSGIPRHGLQPSFSY